VPEFPLRSIVIVGGGTTGWLAAATLARVLGESCPVRLIASADDRPDGAIASVPSLHRLLRLLRIDETALMRATAATFRLGSMFRDWTALGDQYFNGFGMFGARLDAVPFQHHWLRQAATGGTTGFEEFSMSAHLARLDRFAIPQSDPRSVLSLYSYAWHFDSGLLVEYLRDYAIKAGVAEITGEIASVALDSRGSIHELVLAQGGRVEGEFFIDCSGAKAVLGSALGAVDEDWSGWLPCDRMQSLRTDPEDRLPPYSETVADTAGWRSSIPLQHCTEHAQVYCSEFTDDAAIAAKLSAAARNGGSRAPRLQHLVRGRPKEFWARNCLLLPGDTLDPLDGTSLHLAQSGITRFLAHFPVGRSSPTDVAEYNRLTADEYDRLRDLLVLHYHATRRADSPFWDRCRDMPLPESLRRRLALFADSGRITVAEDEHCGVDGWLFVLLGQGLIPKSYDPLAESMPLATARRAFAGISAEMRARAAALPMHRDFIALRGASASP
jgi:tryptophan 7-halogenase